MPRGSLWQTGRGAGRADSGRRANASLVMADRPKAIAETTNRIATRTAHAVVGAADRQEVPVGHSAA